MTSKARNTTRNPALPRPARWRAAKAREAAVVPASADSGTDADASRDSMLHRLVRPRADRSGTASAAGPGTAEATGRTAVLQGVRRLPSRLARPITGRVSAIRRESDIRRVPEGASWVRRFPSPVPRSQGGRAERDSGRFDRSPHAGSGADRTDEPRGRGEGGAERSRPSEDFGHASHGAGKARGRGRMRLGRKSARPADRVPVRYRVARAVGAAASALPESRAVRVGTAVAELVAANQGAIKAGLTAASAVPVLRPYVKVAATAMGAIAVARRIARAKNAAADVAAAFRGPATPGTAHAGNGFDVTALPSQSASGGDAATAPAGAVPADGRGAATRAGTDRAAEGNRAEAAGERESAVGHAAGDRDSSASGRDTEEVDPSAALHPMRRRDGGASTEQGREP